MNNVALMIHGGAGNPDNLSSFHSSIEGVLEEGKKLLQGGASALDVVEHCVMLLENDELFNSGKGSVLNNMGKVEMDAGIMEGKTMRAGNVAIVTNVRNPIHLARLVMEKTDHILLAGKGAMEFAEEQGVPMESSEYFITSKRREQLEHAQKNAKVRTQEMSERKLGTVGAVAIDKEGNLAAATSTGGITNKHVGRIGDTPIPGAGVYAENSTCAVSATGIGEQIARVNLSKHIAGLIADKDMTAQEGADAGITYLVKKMDGLAGVIVIDHKGNMGVAYSTSAIIAAGWSTQKGDFFTC